MPRTEQLTQTAKALDKYLPDICEVRGGRESVYDQPGLHSGPVGFREVDYSIHNPEDVDFMTTESDLTGTDYVRIVDRELPMLINNVLDETPRSELSELSKTKQLVATNLAILLGKALHYEEDDSFVFSIQQASDRTGQNRKITDEVLVVANRDGVAGQIDRAIYEHGLAVVLSDFYRVNFPEATDLRGALAVKVNHLLERELPANVGYISLGGAVEIDTNNPNQLAQVNDALEQKHQEVVESLESAGAQVVSVVADPRLKQGFDVTKTDKDIAKAIEILAR